MARHTSQEPSASSSSTASFLSHSHSRRSKTAWAFVSIALTVLLSALNMASVSTVIPVMVDELEGSHGKLRFFPSSQDIPSALWGRGLQDDPCQKLRTSSRTAEASAVWIGTAFALAGTSILPWTGGLAQIWGRKGLFQLSAVLFALGSALCGFASNVPMLIAGRAVQGLGDGGIMALSEILVADLVPLAERGKWMGVLGCVWALASAAGPIFGGALAAKVTWRWIFLINLPLCCLSLVMVHLTIQGSVPPMSLRAKLQRMDWAGNFGLMASLVLAMTALTMGGASQPWNSPIVISFLVVGGILFVAYFAWQFRWAPYPTVPPALFASRTATAGYVATLLHGLITLATIYLLPAFFQASLGAHVLRASVMSLPFALTISTTAVAAALGIELTQSYRGLNYVGWILVMVGLGLLSLLTESSVTLLWVGYQMPLGVGLGILFVATQFPVLAAVLPQLAAQALATHTFASSLGQTLGVTLSQAVLQTALGDGLKPICGEALTSSGVAYAVPRVHDLPQPLRDEVRSAFAQSFRVVWLSLLPFAALGFLSCLALRALPLHREKDERFTVVSSGTLVGDDLEMTKSEASIQLR